MFDHFRKKLQKIKASKLYRKGMYEEAIKELEKIENKDTETLIGLGRNYFVLKKYEKALHYFLEDEKTGKNIANAHLNIGLTYEALNNYEKAIEHVDKAIGLNSDSSTNAVCYHTKGNIYSELKQFDKANEYYDKALKEDVNAALGVYVNKGNNFMETKQYRSAKEMYLLAYKRIKNNINEDKISNGTVELQLGKSYAALKEDESCRKFLIKALKKNPNLKIDLEENELFDHIRQKDWFRNLINNL